MCISYLRLENLTLTSEECALLDHAHMLIFADMYGESLHRCFIHMASYIYVYIYAQPPMHLLVSWPVVI